MQILTVAELIASPDADERSNGAERKAPKPQSIAVIKYRAK